MSDPKVKYIDKGKRYYEKAREIFNKYIRIRDKDLGCITCGKKVEHAAHCFSAANYPDLEFDEINVNGGCEQCNFYVHPTTEGHAIYLEALVVKYGEEEFNKLIEKATHSKRENYFKPDIDYYKQIAHTYLKKIFDLSLVDF